MDKPKVFELTDEQRAENLARAAQTRVERAALKKRMKAGEVSVADAMADPIAQRMPARQFIAAMPGIGKAHAEFVAEKLHLAKNRRVGGLGDRQREGVMELAEVGFTEWKRARA